MATTAEVPQGVRKLAQAVLLVPHRAIPHALERLQAELDDRWLLAVLGSEWTPVPVELAEAQQDVAERPEVRARQAQMSASPVSCRRTMGSTSPGAA